MSWLADNLKRLGLVVRLESSRRGNEADTWFELVGESASSRRRLRHNSAFLNEVLVVSGVVWLSIAHALSESATTRPSSLSVFPEQIKLPAPGVHRVLVTET